MGRVIVFCPEDSRRLYPDDWYNNAAVTVQEMSPPFSIHDPDNIREYYQRLFDGSTDKKTLTEAIDARSFAQTAAQYKLIAGACRILCQKEEHFRMSHTDAGFPSSLFY